LRFLRLDSDPPLPCQRWRSQSSLIFTPFPVSCFFFFITNPAPAVPSTLAVPSVPSARALTLDMANFQLIPCESVWDSVCVLLRPESSASDLKTELLAAVKSDPSYDACLKPVRPRAFIQHVLQSSVGPVSSLIDEDCVFRVLAHFCETELCVFHVDVGAQRITTTLSRHHASTERVFLGA
jgi:hypothetical protein